jgi:hypothetical protein
MLYSVGLLCSVLSVHGTVGRLATTHLFEPTQCIASSCSKTTQVLPTAAPLAAEPETGARSFHLESPQESVDWSKSISLADDGNGQMTAHFVIDARDVVDETGGIGVVLYLASAEARNAGSYDFRVEITQRRPDSIVTMYAADGSVITGPSPMLLQSHDAPPKPYLPWLDGMKQAYSLIWCVHEGAPCFLFVQHTKEKVVDYDYQSPQVRTILETYARHERLQNRRHWYLDQVDHMRCLPISLTHQQYHHLQQNQTQDVSLAFAQLEGEVVVQGM